MYFAGAVEMQQLNVQCSTFHTAQMEHTDRQTEREREGCRHTMQC